MDAIHLTRTSPPSRRSNDAPNRLPKRWRMIYSVPASRILILVLLAKYIHETNASSSASGSSYGYVNDDAKYQTMQEEEAEEKRLHELLVEDWFDLVRYIVGLGFCILGLIGLYFHQFASYHFLNQYRNERRTEQRKGRVLACEALSPEVTEQEEQDESRRATKADDGDGQCNAADLDISATYSMHSYQSTATSASTNYRIFVMYTAPVPFNHDVCTGCATPHAMVNPYPLMETEYVQGFLTRKQLPIDSEVPLILLKGQPQSACTPELLHSHLRQGFNEKNCQAVSLLGLGLLAGTAALLAFSVLEILAMPHPEQQRPIGWTILASCLVFSVVAGYVLCKLLFDHFKQKVFLSAVPFSSVPRRKKTTDAGSRILNAMKHGRDHNAVDSVDNILYRQGPDPPPGRGDPTSSTSSSTTSTNSLNRLPWNMMMPQQHPTNSGAGHPTSQQQQEQDGLFNTEGPTQPTNVFDGMRDDDTMGNKSNITNVERTTSEGSNGTRLSEIV